MPMKNFTINQCKNLHIRKKEKKGMIKRNEKLEELATDFVWMVVRKFHKEKSYHRCSLCIRGQHLKKGEICPSNCEDNGFKDSISINEAINRVIDALDRRI